MGKSRSSSFANPTVGLALMRRREVDRFTGAKGLSSGYRPLACVVTGLRPVKPAEPLIMARLATVVASVRGGSLTGLAMNTNLQNLLGELRRGLESLYGKRLAGMFLCGSHVRGEHKPGSDIDVLVVLRGTVNPGHEIARTGRLLSSVCLQNNEVIACVFISEERLREEQALS